VVWRGAQPTSAVVAEMTVTVWAIFANCELGFHAPRANTLPLLA
jgi:hypothetical protein